jgi:nucleotide-binding universal stress UspA family protein
MSVPDVQLVEFPNVLLATDFSPSAEAALLHALSFARRWQARLFVAHVVNPTTIFGEEAVQREIDDAWRDAHAEMTNQLIAGRLEGVENHVIVRQGELWPELEKMISEFHIQLLVTGTRGRSGVLKMLLGSTAETIFRSSPIPVLTVGPKVNAEAPVSGPKRILYATGFAAQSLYAGKFAVAVAERNQAQLAMLHVVKDAPDDLSTRETLRHENEERLRHLVPAAASLPRAPELRVAFGPAAEAILSTAEVWHPDVIVLGLRRQSQESHQGAWATAYHVVSNAPCPVLTVRTPEDHPPQINADKH